MFIYVYIKSLTKPSGSHTHTGDSKVGGGGGLLEGFNQGGRRLREGNKR